MLQEETKVSNETAGTPRWVGLGIAALGLLNVASLGIAWNSSNRAASAEQALVIQRQTDQKDDQAIVQRVAQSEETSARLQSDLGVVTDKLKLTQGELARARANSKKLQEEYGKQLGEVETSVRNELATKASAEDVNAKMGALSGDVNGVRSDLEGTRRDLGMARSEFGTLIARNHEEVEQLRRMGQRDYHEFTLVKKGSRERLGTVTLELRGVNVKKNQFTVALYADDKRLKEESLGERTDFLLHARHAPTDGIGDQRSEQG